MKITWQRIKVNAKRMYNKRGMSQKLLFIKDNRRMYCEDDITKGSLHNTKRMYYEYDVTMSSVHKGSLKRMYYKDDVMKAYLHKW